MDQHPSTFRSLLDVPPAWMGGDGVLPRWDLSLPPRHVHVIPSLSLGGAERIVAELARTFSECGIEADIAVLRDAPAEHAIDAPGVTVHRLGQRPWSERLAYLAGLVRATRLPAYCHLTSEGELAKLWGFGVSTVPVVHNARDGWRQDPAAWQDNPLVPYVAACGDLVASDLEAAGVTAPIRVLRHIIREPAVMTAEHRAHVRSIFGAGPNTLLIGMTGRIVVQKRYTRAVRILAELRRRGQDARLAIVGGMPDSEGPVCRKAILGEAARLGVADRVVLAGAVQDAARLVPAYDIFLNTSLWEGVSISTMEAVACGVPVVTADVGGQDEAIAPDDRLVPAMADDAEWADAILELAAARPERTPRDTYAARHAAASVWPWMLALGPGAPAPRSERPCDILFVTGNMDVGGAQRSLCNLAAELGARKIRATVAVGGPAGVPGFMSEAASRGVEFLDVSGGSTFSGWLRGRVGRILALAMARAPKTLCFWNMDAETKLVIGKILERGPIRVADVSPGPMLYKELDAQADFARLMSTSPDSYVHGLDLLVSKYSGGEPNGRPWPRRYAVIPNGVPRPSGTFTDYASLPRPPAGRDPALAVVTVGRLVAAKRPELLPLVAGALQRRVPGATLTVVGGTHGTDPDGAWTNMMETCGGTLPDNLYFAGPHDRTLEFLPGFAAFYMVSTDQGCPNASLEAMMSGLPVVANPDGGTGEQISDGVNGRLVADPGDPHAFAGLLAGALAEILGNPALGKTMGAASRSIATRRFSMDAMACRYIDALLG